MHRRAMWIAINSLLLILTPVETANAAEAAKFKAPRTEFGHPDLQGVWNYSSDVPLERPADFADKDFFTPAELQKLKETRAKLIDQFSGIGVGGGGKEFFDFDARIQNLRTSLIIYPRDGKMPPLQDGVESIGLIAAVFTDIKGTQPVRFTMGGIGKAGPEERGLFERCLTLGPVPPYMPSFENNFIQIVQSRDNVVILNEQIHDARAIPLDGRPFELTSLRSWSGESRGRWEGDTLVVVTKNFNDRMQSFNGSGTSYHKIVTERFTRSSADSLTYEATIEDSATFKDKIVLTFPMARTDARIFEFACHEGNYALPGILAGARKQEADMHMNER